jgi:heparan-alpha-glucosaminide N-acetyltransferase
MNTAVQPALASRSATSVASRIVSIDVFRGLTMATMIFVNQLSGVQGLPWWTYHAHAMEDRMTYVDMVFPTFLFIVGMSMPLSVAQRLKRNPSLPLLWLHVIVRSVALVVLGLILANVDYCDPARMGMRGGVWGLLGVLSAGLYLNVYPKSERFASLFRALRITGLVGIVVLFAIFRRTTPDGHSAWIDFSYPEILGLIGLSYFASALLYIPTRRWKAAPYLWFALLVAFNALVMGKMITFPNHLPLYLFPWGNGALPCLILAGVITSSIYLGVNPGDTPRPAPAKAMAIATGLGVLMLATGQLLTPFGISKIRATPTWCLWSIGAAMLIFTLLFWICDLRQKTGWAFWVHSAGANTLTTYLLPDIWDYLSITFTITFLDRYLVTGAPAIAKTFAFTFCILAISWVVTKMKVRLQL